MSVLQAAMDTALCEYIAEDRVDYRLPFPSTDSLIVRLDLHITLCKCTAAIAAVAVLSTCTTQEQRKRAAENAAVEKDAAAEIKRICALPQAERDAELAKVKAESGLVITCGRK